MELVLQACLRLEYGRVDRLYQFRPVVAEVADCRCRDVGRESRLGDLREELAGVVEILARAVQPLLA
jgi:hypothetical protein